MKSIKIPSLLIWQKLSIVILLMALPMAPLIYYFFETRTEQIEGTQDEVLGLEYLAVARQLLDAVATHRDATQAVLAGDTSFQGTVERAKASVGQAADAVSILDARAPARWESAAKWADIKRSWSNLAVNPSLDRDESFQRHTALADLLLHLMRSVSTQSGLQTDANPNAFHLVHALFDGIVPAIESVSQARGLATSGLARGALSLTEKAQLLVVSKRISENAREIETSIHSVERFQPEAAKGLIRIWRPALQGSNEMIDKMQKDLIEPVASPAGARAFYELSTRAIRDYSSLYDEGSTAMLKLLNTRIETHHRERSVQLVIVIVVLWCAMWLVFSIIQGISKQTRAISILFTEIGSGNLNARAGVVSEDELGDIAKELNVMLDDILQLADSREEKEAIQRSILKLLGEVSGVASGDLTRDAEVTGDVTGAIADSFNYMLGELRQIIASVQNTTAAVTGSATDVQRTASQLSYGSQAQSNAIGHASSAIADMARSIQQVSQSASMAAEIAQRAVRDAKGGAATVGKTIEGMNAIRSRVQETSKRMKRLGESSQEIGEIVRLIADIADRTGILALNASIQASTAGEAGKGFAVVAEEVERLAVRAAESTRKISALIKSVQGDTTEAVRAMEETTREVVGGSRLANEAGQRLRDIEHISQEMASLIAQISSASQQQAAGSEEVARNVAGISQFTQQTASGAQLTEESTRHLADLALELNASISRFKLPEGV